MHLLMKQSLYLWGYFKNNCVVTSYISTKFYLIIFYF